MKGSIITRKGKNGDISYQLKYYSGKDPQTGKWKRQYKTMSGVSKKEAQKELRRLLSAIDDNTHVDLTKQTLCEWIEIWKKIIEPIVSAKTFERYNDFCRHQIVPRLGLIPIQKLSGADIEIFYSKLRTEGRVANPRNPDIKRGLAPKTILHVHRTLSQILNEAVKKKVIARNPADDVTTPKSKKATTSAHSNEGSGEVVQALDLAQLSQLMKVFVGHRLFPIFALAAGTGMRRGEILGLSWSDVNTEKRTVFVRRVIEETNAFGIRIKSRPKTDSSRRTILIDAGLNGVLKKMWQNQSEEYSKIGFQISNDFLLFPKSQIEPTLPLRPRIVTNIFKRKALEAGFPTLRFHDLRHTHATILLMANIPINTVSARLGHANATLTLNTYGHVLNRSEGDAVNVAATMLPTLLK